MTKGARPQSPLAQRALARAAFLVAKLLFAFLALIDTMQGEFAWAAWAISLAALLEFVDTPRLETYLKAARPHERVNLVVNAACFAAVPAAFAQVAYLQSEPWGWALAGLYAITACIGIVRSKVEPDHRSKPSVQGLPPAAAAIVLVTIYPFFTASGVAPLLGGLPNAQETGGILISLLILMVSPISYRIAPRLSLQRGHRKATSLLILCVGACALAPELLLFPLLVAYTFWGIAESLAPVATEGILERKGDVGDDDSSDAPESYRASSSWE